MGIVRAATGYGKARTAGRRRTRPRPGFGAPASKSGPGPFGIARWNDGVTFRGGRSLASQIGHWPFGTARSAMLADLFVVTVVGRFFVAVGGVFALVHIF